MEFQNLKLAGLVVAMAGTLSACGSNGVSYGELETQGEALIAKYEETDVTPEGQMPTEGTATYRGVAALGEGTTEQDVYGKMTMTADFGANTIGGKITNLREPEGAIGGSLDITEGVITGNTFTADVNGDVTVSGEGVATVDAGASGVFLGENYEAIAADIGGTIVMDGETTDFGGIMGGERD